MFKEIMGIEIQGQYFTQETKLDFFKVDKKPNYISVVYGKNGTGKSSITRAFSEYKSNELNFEKVELYNQEGSIIDREKIPLDRICVFDEDYIRKYVRFEDSGLQAVVMLGEQVELDKDIKSLEKQSGDIEKEIDTLNEISASTFDCKSSDKCPDKHKNSILDSLRTKWAVNEGNLKQLKQNARVNESKIEEMLKYINSHPDMELIIEQDYLSEVDLFQSIKDENTVSILEIPIISKGKISKIKTVLHKQLKEPEYTGIEKDILNIIKSNEIEFDLINESKKYFSKDENKICPFCIRPISNNEREELLLSIKKVFDNKESLEHQNEIEALKVNEVNQSLEDYKKIDSSLYSQLMKELKKYNEFISEINNLITNKKSKIYTPISINEQKYIINISAIEELVKKLNIAIDKYNTVIAERDKQKDDLLSKNFLLAVSENKKNLLDYQSSKTYKEEHKNKIIEKEKISKEIKTEIKTLENKKQNIDIAVDLINKHLAYIFFEKDRLKIIIKDGSYRVNVNNTSVPLRTLSVGEKNAIALCYFFSELYKGKDITKLFEEDFFIILDDPITCFDFENKIGLHSYIRAMISSINKGNSESRFLILTHDFQSASNFDRTISDLKLNGKFFVLKDKQLKKIQNFNKLENEYSRLIETIFQYASNENENSQSDNDTIGNVMRRTLEAFGTFQYKTGIEELSTNSDILNQLGSEEKKEHFENLMYRLVLNGESHLAERTKSVDSLDFYNFIDTKEKVKTAKDILIFIKSLNRLHLRSHLSGGEDKKKTETVKDEKLKIIDEWEKNFFN